MAKRNPPLSRRMADDATLIRPTLLVASFRGKPSPRALIAGDLGNHLLHDGAAEGLEILRHDDEGPGAPNDVVAIVFLQSAGRIDMLDIPDEWNPRVAENRQAVDRDALRDRLVAGELHVAAGIVGAVARYVDGAALGLERRPSQVGA